MQERYNPIQQLNNKPQRTNSSERFLLREKIKQIQTEMVKLTFEAEMDQRLFTFFSTQLKRVKKQLSLV